MYVNVTKWRDFYEKSDQHGSLPAAERKKKEKSIKAQRAQK